MKVCLTSDNQLSTAYLQHRDLLEASDKYDLIIEARDLTPEQLQQYRRILLLERCDSATIGGAPRRLLGHENVAKLLKMYYYDSLDIQNRPMVDGRAFVPLNGTEKPFTIALTEADLAKVEPGLNFYHYQPVIECIEYCATHKSIPFMERFYDYSFIGTVDYSPGKGSAYQYIGDCRKEVIKRIKSYKEAKVYVAAGRPVKRVAYFHIMANTRHAPSPFGWGEYCYRDYECLLLGCAVEKPQNKDTDKLRDMHGLWPFTYGTTVPAEPPHKDARSFIQRLLS